MLYQSTHAPFGIQAIAHNAFFRHPHITHKISCAKFLVGASQCNTYLCSSCKTIDLRICFVCVAQFGIPLQIFHILRETNLCSCHITSCAYDSLRYGSNDNTNLLATRYIHGPCFLRVTTSSKSPVARKCKNACTNPGYDASISHGLYL